MRSTGPVIGAGGRPTDAATSAKFGAFPELAPNWAEIC
jgi:hypothetical protein